MPSTITGPTLSPSICTSPATRSTGSMSVVRPRSLTASVPRSIEIVGVRDHGTDDAITAIVDRWPSLSRLGLLAAAHAALAAPDLEIDVSVRAAA